MAKKKRERHPVLEGEELILTRSTANYLHYSTAWPTQRIANHLKLSLRQLNELLFDDKGDWQRWERARKLKKGKS